MTENDTEKRQNQVNMIARSYLYLMSLVNVAIGLAALFAPATIASKFDLLPLSIKGIAEVRGLYGGGIFAWGVVLLGALRCKSLSPGLLMAMATMMGSIAAVRATSLIVDHEIQLNISAGFAEALSAVACWIAYKHIQANH